MTDPLRPNVLLSIHPENAEAILDHEKLWEYRRRAPACDPPYRVVLYATAPVKAAIGACWVFTDYAGRPATVVARTVHDTPNDPQDVLDYLDGAQPAHALRVMGPRRFENPTNRETLEAAGVAPTQNFRYLPDIDPLTAAMAGAIL